MSVTEVEAIRHHQRIERQWIDTRDLIDFRLDADMMLGVYVDVSVLVSIPSVFASWRTEVTLEV